MLSNSVSASFSNMPINLSRIRRTVWYQKLWNDDSDKGKGKADIFDGHKRAFGYVER